MTVAETTTPFFIVSSGRSGTQMFEKLLQGIEGVDMHHEYLCTHIQPVSAGYYMGLLPGAEVRATVERLHGRAVRCSDKRLWGDSSNKLSWIIPVLAEAFPSARFIYLVRDGRKVVSSFYHKLADEMYDDRSVAVLDAFLRDPEKNPCPPPEKKYWWNIPVNNPEAYARFKAFDRFERVCWHWTEVNRVIRRDLDQIGKSRWLMTRLEDLAADPEVLKGILSFLGLEYSEELFGLLKRPHNVHRPVNYPLTPRETERFFDIAGETMKELGYEGQREYEVAY